MSKMLRIITCVLVVSIIGLGVTHDAVAYAPQGSTMHLAVPAAAPADEDPGTAEEAPRFDVGLWSQVAANIAVIAGSAVVIYCSFVSCAKK